MYGTGSNPPARARGDCGRSDFHTRAVTGWAATYVSRWRRGGLLSSLYPSPRRDGFLSRIDGEDALPDSQLEHGRKVFLRQRDVEDSHFIDGHRAEASATTAVVKADVNGSGVWIDGVLG